MKEDEKKELEHHIRNSLTTIGLGIKNIEKNITKMVWQKDDANKLAHIFMWCQRVRDRVKDCENYLNSIKPDN